MTEKIKENTISFRQERLNPVFKKWPHLMERFNQVYKNIMKK